MTRKGRIDFDALNRSLLSQAERLLSSWLPGGVVRGREFVAGSVSGEAGGSLSINLDTGVGADFASGEKFGDLIDVYAAVRGVPIGDAVKALREIAGLPEEAPPPRAKLTYQLGPPPPGAPLITGPKAWGYRDRNGDLMFYVERIDLPDGSKEFRPHSYDLKSGRWVSKMWPAPRPLYNLPALTAGARVIIVEGEKAADAAREFVGNYACLSWCGGANAVAKADWTPLQGRDVVVWPDADPAGLKAAGAIVTELLAVGAKAIKVLDVSDMPKGWDAADADFKSSFEFIEWAKPRARAVDSSAAGEPAKVPTAPAENVQTSNANADNAGVLRKILPHWSTGKGEPRPLATIENLEALFGHLGIVVRYNVISKQEEVLIPGEAYSIDNEANAALAHILSLQTRIGMSNANLKDYLTRIADRHQYNPVAKWIESRPWDGVSRLQELYATIVAKNEIDPLVMSLKKTLIRRWLISAIAGAFSPRGVSAHGVLVLQGDQYIGKTAWVKSLAPSDMQLIADGRILKPDDKDSVAQIVRYWIVELGELDATFRKADIAQLKSFITKDSDIFRRAYAARESVYARRTVFFASVNPAEFLHDETGNRRFWTIECEAVNHQHALDMQQVWAEVLELYRGGETWFLLPEEMAALNGHNESFMARDAVEDRVGCDLNWFDDEKNWRWKPASETLRSLGIDSPSQGQIKKASQEIFKRNSRRRKKSHGVMMLLTPPKFTTSYDYRAEGPLMTDAPSPENLNVYGNL